jgi:protoheme IX farnesyltransferase
MGHPAGKCQATPLLGRGARAARSLPQKAVGLKPIIYYIRVLKPKETILLAFIGILSAVLAGGGRPPLLPFLLASLAVTVGSAGTNGLTNYLDRYVDALMERTKHRVLPAGLIHPPERMLPWAGLLVGVGLALAWYLHPYAFAAGAVGLLCALVARKTWVTHFLGAISSTGPVLVGWLAINPHLNATIILLTLLVLLWVPVHIWNLMVAYREDYIRAGVDIFPLTRSIRLTVWLSLGLSVAMYAVSLALWRAGGFSWLYFAIANVVGPMMVLAGLQAVRRGGGASSYRTFKLSAYPFLGLTFLGLVLDVWVRTGL